MKNNLTVLKIGGSIVTHKKQHGGLNASAVLAIAKEIKSALRKAPVKLILIHGAGGEAHKIAGKFKLKNGAIDAKAMYGALQTHSIVSSLNKEISAIFQKEKVPIFPIQTSTCFYRQNLKLIFHNTMIIEKALSLGMVPLLYGDMILDDQKNFSILSGDTIATECAKKFHADRVLFATDVDGVYKRTPQKNKMSEIIQELNRKEARKLYSINTGASKDTTGEMYGKILSIIESKVATPVLIFNGLTPGNVKKVLLGEKIGTYIK